MNDLTLKAGNGYFSYRVGAIIIQENKLLMIKNSNSPYYYSVGGRVKFGESSEDAVLREIFEETNVEFEIDRLAFIHENFFTADFLGNELFHEIALFYLMKPNNNIKNIKCNSVGVDGGKESAHWLPIEKLSDFEIYPSFFKTDWKKINNQVGHFITKDGKTYACL